MTKTNFTKEHRERVDYARREFLIALEIANDAKFVYMNAVDALNEARQRAADEYADVLNDEMDDEYADLRGEMGDEEDTQ